MGCRVMRTAFGFPPFPQFWVKEVGQTGTIVRHKTQNGQKCCHTHSPFKSTVHKGNMFPCSEIITQMAYRRISTPPSVAFDHAALDTIVPSTSPALWG